MSIYLFSVSEGRAFAQNENITYPPDYNYATKTETDCIGEIDEFKRCFRDNLEIMYEKTQELSVYQYRLQEYARLGILENAVKTDYLTGVLQKLVSIESILLSSIETCLQLYEKCQECYAEGIFMRLKLHAGSKYNRFCTDCRIKKLFKIYKAIRNSKRIVWAKGVSSSENCRGNESKNTECEEAQNIIKQYSSKLSLIMRKIETLLQKKTLSTKMIEINKKIKEIRFSYPRRDDVTELLMETTMTVHSCIKGMLAFPIDKLLDHGAPKYYIDCMNIIVNQFPPIYNARNNFQIENELINSYIAIEWMFEPSVENILTCCDIDPQ